MSQSNSKSLFCGEGSFSVITQLDGTSVVLNVDHTNPSIKRISQQAARMLQDSGKRVMILSESTPRCSEANWELSQMPPDWMIVIGNEAYIEKVLSFYVPSSSSWKESYRLHFCAIPTDYALHGSRSETFVIKSKDTERSADLCILDPKLSRMSSAFPEIHDALAGLTQATEAYLSPDHTQRSDGFAKYAFTHIYMDLQDYAFRSRESLDTASLLSLRKLFSGSGHRGLTQASAQILSHRFSNLGIHIPYGVLCGIILPKVLAFNVSTSIIRQRCADLAVSAGRQEHRDRERIASFLLQFENLISALYLPLCLREWISQETFNDMIPDLCTAILAHPDTASNPRLPSRGELEQLLHQCYQEDHIVFPLTRHSTERSD